MMDPYQHIEDYVFGRLSAEEQKGFEEAMSRDADLRRLVKDHPMLSRIADSFLEHELETEVSGVHQEFSRSGNDPKVVRPAFEVRNRKWWLLAAAITGLVLVGWWLIRTPGSVEDTLTAQEVYDRFYEDPVWPASRGGETTTFEERAYDAFQRGEFEQAKGILTDSIEDKDMGRYWLAEMYLKRMEADSVLKYGVINEMDPPNNERIVYLVTMAYLMKGDKAAAVRAISSTTMRDPRLQEFIEK